MSLNLDKLPDKKFYTIDEVCSRWKCNTELIFHYVFEEKILRLAVKNGRLWRIPVYAAMGV